MFLYVGVVDIKDILKLFNNTLIFLTRIMEKVYMDETKRTLGELVKKHTSNIANNLSAVAEHYQKTGHNPDLNNN